MKMLEQAIRAAVTAFPGHGQDYRYYRIQALEEAGIGKISSLPYCMKILLEAAVREFDGVTVTAEHVRKLANSATQRDPNEEVPFKPTRVLLHDTTGLPALVDLAAMRETVQAIGGDPSCVNPLIPVDLVVDHSVMVDYFGTSDALALNQQREFERNFERFRFFRWVQNAFQNVRIIPPASGIMHQINMEYLSTVVASKEVDGVTVLYPDSLVGTDSHTTMINGLGIVAWGVGGIEAEAAILGQPLYFVAPEVVGFRLTGSLPEGATATDLALTVTHLLRKKGVVGKFVEFIGPGVSTMSLADRATIANMAPEYGATMGYFPVDSETLNYLRMIGHTEEHVALIEAYYRAQGMFVSENGEEPVYTDVIELDLSTVVPSLAGPKRPQDQVPLAIMKQAFEEIVRAPIDQGGYGLSESDLIKSSHLTHPSGEKTALRHGAVVLAAITSCTNTSNPSVLICAGLLAKKAVEKGLKKPAYVKTSLTPGSRVITDYLNESGLSKSLDALGFHVAGYGCATCIGNSGPLPAEVSQAIVEHDLVTAAVLSGNRNFEGRIHPQVKANYLASPPLVVAYALAGTVTIDFATEPIGFDQEGQPVFLKDLWPSAAEIREGIAHAVRPELFRKSYQNVLSANEQWNAIEPPLGQLYEWDADSTYIQQPPFLSDLAIEASDIREITSARVLAYLGDSVTTDHASPSGSILPKSPAGRYLQSLGVGVEDFNSYPSRRGNHLVMVRGAFANPRIRNKLAPGSEGGVTTYLPREEVMTIYDASVHYQAEGVPLAIIAGKEYGTGSSRDWAAKGPYLLGVKFIIAESFERIHRSNLVGMGILPLQFVAGTSAASLGITGHESLETIGLQNDLKPGQIIQVKATRPDKSSFLFDVIVRLDNVVDIAYYRNGGIMQSVVRRLVLD
ncbi:aconitate hydratase [Brevibacillus centrosporus]|uniref:Aconitate hydratase n=2 Tax=Brevibacillus centrosporus TaxID=54910 RepID=A0A1I4DNY8_9BACL|nr:aconitate hydratase [Brevibacillus centrosporus]SFK94380.1 aconitate hydratase [Brevibacillus centrosporus]